MAEARPLRLDHRGVGSLDGTWDFFPGVDELGALPADAPATIEVPALWEAQGWLQLDGPAVYRQRFVVAPGDRRGWWTLRFGAVMDTAVVHVNGQPVGGHDSPFTPFELDVTDAVRDGVNELEVLVVDHPLDSPEHIRSAHGKQGWANHVFPSRPSLYMTYGGIWQTVTIRRHGPVRVEDVFVLPDPDDLRVRVALRNLSSASITARLGVRAVGVVNERECEVPAGAMVTEEVVLGPTVADRWDPAAPVLHDALVDVVTAAGVSDAATTRFGLRTLAVQGTRILLNGEPYRMKSVLVQGFRAEELYAEGDRTAIVEEVEAARQMGFNTLRLHIKAFDPTYLDVCDEMGMLLHCDLPVAEPIAHAEMGADTELARRCVEAIREQVRRDRNHPSILLWSAMNELTLDGIEWRPTEGYEGFARTLAAAVAEEDPTRPFIENDWVEPEPERVFTAPVLTAHWYGRLHRDYLDKLEADCARWSNVDKPLYVTEFGDWGLPAMPDEPDPPFWETRTVYAAGLAAARWVGSISRFVTETQRYQGLSDRLQAEVFRRHDHIGGYCLTELTDVPHELNGLLDLHRRPKPLAVAEVVRLNQVVLPMLELESLVFAADALLRARLHIANDGPALDDVEVAVRFGDTDSAIEQRLPIGAVPAHRVTSRAGPRVRAPITPGAHDLLVELRAGGDLVSSNRYPIHVVTRPEARLPVQVLESRSGLVELLRELGATPGDQGPLVIAEGTLDEATGKQLRAHLDDGGTAVVLAQGRRAAPHYPCPVTLEATQTKWGSSEFHLTTDSGALPSLPRHNLLVAEDSTVQARTVVTEIGGAAFPTEPVVIAFKPVPDAMTGTIIGAQDVGPGRMLFSQYRVVQPALDGDAAARAVLADLLHWAVSPRSPLRREDIRRADGRTVRLYSWDGA